MRNAIARSDQTTGVTDDYRALAFASIKKAQALRRRDVGIRLDELGRKPSTGRTAEDRREAAQKAAQTRKRRGH